jgi:hypothetical protein
VLYVLYISIFKDCVARGFDYCTNSSINVGFSILAPEYIEESNHVVTGEINVVRDLQVQLIRLKYGFKDEV